MTEKQLTRLANWWLPRLCLSDWRVTVVIPPKRAMRGAAGDCCCQPEIRHARIRISPEVEAAEVEQTLVHELLHIHFHSFFRTRPARLRVAQEATIDAIARALVAVKHKRKKG
jgi:hypothetical protein